MKKLFAWIMVAILLFGVCAVSIFAFTYGDITNDGKINTKDAVLLAQYLAEWQVSISADGLAAADVYKDGKINSKDAVLLAQYLAMWNVTLGDGSSGGGNGGIGGYGGNGGNGGNGGTGDNEIPSDGIFD